MKTPEVQFHLNYKSYRAVYFKNGVSSCGAPAALMVKVRKSGKTTLSVEHNWFSEQRGVGGASGRKVVVQDAELKLLAKRCLDDATAVAGLIDRIQELGTEGTSALFYGEVVLWLRYWTADNAEAQLWADRRQAALDRKPAIDTGSLVWLFDYPDRLFRVLGFYFDWIDGLGGPGWRVLLRGRSPDAYKVHEPKPEHAGLPVVE